MIYSDVTNVDRSYDVTIKNMYILYTIQLYGYEVMKHNTLHESLLTIGFAL